MSDGGSLSVHTIIKKTTLHQVWECWTKPAHIVNWAFASDTWEAPYAENTVEVGGRFKTVMAAKDKSAAFDFCGTYTLVEPLAQLEFTMDDGRKVQVIFTKLPHGVRVREVFEPETINSRELQRSGWLAILENFKKYVEACR